MDRKMTMKTKTKPAKKFKATYHDGVPFGVDAGNISVLDLAFIEENGGADGGLSTTTIELPHPGTYRVAVKVMGCWEGKPEATSVINVKGTKLIVGDACYSWEDQPNDNDATYKKWLKFLTKTKYFKDMKGRGVSVDTGGDGSFVVRVKVEEV